MEWAIIVLSVLILISIYVIFNLYRKNEILQKIADNQSDWIDYSGDTIKGLYVRLKQVDNRNIFEKDDDVGFIFAELLRLTQETDKKLNSYESEIKEINKNVVVTEENINE